MNSPLISYIRQKRKKMRKVVIIGPTGSGKTSFLANFTNGKIIPTSDVKRRPNIEEQVDNGYVSLKMTKSAKSSTTISLNQLSVRFILTKSNSLQYTIEKTSFPFEEIDRLIPINFIDNPGQERFQFMTEISILGADAAIIIVDGTSTASLASLPSFLKIIQNEASKRQCDIPTLVFVNKLDLADQNLFLGSDTVMRMFGELIEKYNIIIFETTNKSAVTFEIPMRTLINLIPEMPVCAY